MTMIFNNTLLTLHTYSVLKTCIYILDISEKYIGSRTRKLKVTENHFSTCLWHFFLHLHLCLSRGNNSFFPPACDLGQVWVELVVSLLISETTFPRFFYFPFLFGTFLHGNQSNFSFLTRVVLWYKSVGSNRFACHSDLNFAGILCSHKCPISSYSGKL